MTRSICCVSFGRLIFSNSLRRATSSASCVKSNCSINKRSASAWNSSPLHVSQPQHQTHLAASTPAISSLPTTRLTLSSQSAAPSPSSIRINILMLSRPPVKLLVLGRGLSPGERRIEWVEPVVPSSADRPGTLVVVLPIVLPLDRGGRGNKLPPLGELGVDPRRPPESRDMADGRRRGGVAPSATTDGDVGAYDGAA